ncbi:Putative oxidoreductase SadH [Pandoraea captiosa]|uniref:Oxidoreductase SadH n=1 Tax=Pandoraea captiosa TaxID=2508302 RepID=A0A5E5ABC2_9BURK|nr:SDR family NAD(P)-dependent oxidoreductase [Pandoraea captiosa]VVE70112.1 Putative oxidoreductase SadH [Pandoraea captiosa]
MNTEANTRVAVVTGAASGIGRALVHALALRGDTVVAADVDVPGLARTMKDIPASGGRVVSAHVDVSRAADVEKLADIAFAIAGRVDLLINNAGVLRTGNCWLTSEAEWRRTLDVNLWSVIHAARAFVPRMLAKGGHIVNVASMAGLTAGPELSAYTVSKFGVVAHSECLAGELAAIDAPIKVSVVCPGAVDTAIADAIHESNDRQGNLAQTNAGLQQIIRNGTKPDAFASALLADVDAGKFWIIPHAEVFAAFAQRARTILRESSDTGLWEQATTCH